MKPTDLRSLFLDSSLFTLVRACKILDENYLIRNETHDFKIVAINTPIPFIADVTDVQHENEATQY